MLETDWSLDMLSESIDEDCRDIHSHGNLQVHCHVARKDMVLWVSTLHLLAIVIAAMRSHFEPHTLSFMPHPSP